MTSWVQTSQIYNGTLMLGYTKWEYWSYNIKVASAFKKCVKHNKQMAENENLFHYSIWTIYDKFVIELHLTPSLVYNFQSKHWSNEKYSVFLDSDVATFATIDWQLATYKFVDNLTKIHQTVNQSLYIFIYLYFWIFKCASQSCISYNVNFISQ